MGRMSLPPPVNVCASMRLDYVIGVGEARNAEADA